MTLGGLLLARLAASSLLVSTFCFITIDLQHDSTTPGLAYTPRLLAAKFCDSGTALRCQKGSKLGLLKDVDLSTAPAH